MRLVKTSIKILKIIKYYNPLFLDNVALDSKTKCKKLIATLSEDPCSRGFKSQGGPWLR